MSTATLETEASASTPENMSTIAAEDAAFEGSPHQLAGYPKPSESGAAIAAVIDEPESPAAAALPENPVEVSPPGQASIVDPAALDEVDESIKWQADLMKHSQELEKRAEAMKNIGKTIGKRKRDHEKAETRVAELTADRKSAMDASNAILKAIEELSEELIALATGKISERLFPPVAEADEAESPAPTADPAPTQGTVAVPSVEDDAWRSVKLADLPKMPARAIKAFAARRPPLETLGELSDFTGAQSRDHGGNNQLTDVKGLGKETATKVDEVLMAYWTANARKAEPVAAEVADDAPVDQVSPSTESSPVPDAVASELDDGRSIMHINKVWPYFGDCACLETCLMDGKFRWRAIVGIGIAYKVYEFFEPFGTRSAAIETAVGEVRAFIATKLLNSMGATLNHATEFDAALKALLVDPVAAQPVEAPADPAPKKKRTRKPAE